MELSRTLIWWKVRCLKRQDKTFFDRYLVLDWSKPTPEQQAHVSALVENISSKPAIVQYRWSFREVDQEELERLLSQAQGTRCVFLALQRTWPRVTLVLREGHRGPGR